jgi:hypothetical protein
MRTIPRSACFGPLLGLSFVIATPGLAAAKTLYVTVSGSDWATNCTINDPCETISRAVYVAATGDTISVGPGLIQEQNPIVIGKNVSIVGAGSEFGTTVTTNGKGTVFKILSGASVAISGTRIFGGKGVEAGGILNRGSLSLYAVTIRGNAATGAQVGYGFTGGIRNEGSLVLNRVTVQLNTGAAVGGIFTTKTAIIVESKIVSNTAQPTIGAIGGILNWSTLIVADSAVAWNTGDGIVSAEAAGGVALTNVTISGNSGDGFDYSGASGNASLSHVTLAGNGRYGLIRSHGAGNLELRNSIVANNKGAVQCADDIQSPGEITLRHSLLGDFSCSKGWPDPFSLLGVDPKLSALGYFNGFTPIHRLTKDSPAIDAASSQWCPGTDQHNTPRPRDGNADGVASCDMGAQEYLILRQPPV